MLTMFWCMHMNKLIFILSIMTMLLFAGCGPDESQLLEDDTITETTQESVVEKVVEKVIEVKEPTEDVLPTETKTIETKITEKKTETQKESDIETAITKSVETKTTTTAKPLDDYTAIKPVEPKTFVGQIGDINPVKNGVYTGELTALDSTYKHYKFTSKISVLRGDKVKFTLDKNDLATVVEKILDERLAKITTTKTAETPLPANARLGKIKSIINNVNGGFKGKIVDAESGVDYRYESLIEYNFNQFIFFTISKTNPNNGEIIRKA